MFLQTNKIKIKVVSYHVVVFILLDAIRVFPLLNTKGALFFLLFPNMLNFLLVKCAKPLSINLFMQKIEFEIEKLSVVRRAEESAHCFWILRAIA